MTDLDAGQFFEIGHLRFDVGRKGMLVHQKTDLGSLGLLPVDRLQKRSPTSAPRKAERQQQQTSFLFSYYASLLNDLEFHRQTNGLPIIPVSHNGP